MVRCVKNCRAIGSVWELPAPSDEFFDLLKYGNSTNITGICQFPSKILKSLTRSLSRAPENGK